MSSAPSTHSLTRSSAPPIRAVNVTRCAEAEAACVGAGCRLAKPAHRTLNASESAPRPPSLSSPTAAAPAATSRSTPAGSVRAATGSAHGLAVRGARRRQPAPRQPHLERALQHRAHSRCQRLPGIECIQILFSDLGRVGSAWMRLRDGSGQSLGEGAGMEAGVRMPAVKQGWSKDGGAPAGQSRACARCTGPARALALAQPPPPPQPGSAAPS
eukprot:293653-Rhodomonas_salina.1